jgi:DNA invertase Pin-like site-specific DNA recombinase
MTMAYPDSILDSKFENNRLFYLVKWKRCNIPTWEPEHHISHRTDLIETYRDMLILEDLSMSEQIGYIYCRVSTKTGGIGDTSLAVQEATIRAFCTQHNIHISKCVYESYTARDMNRLKGLRYLCDIARPGQTIYIYDVTRFSRNIHHALNVLDVLVTKRVTIHSVHENITFDHTSSGRNQFRLQLCASQYYSELISTKVKESVVVRRQRGDYIGRAPFGFKTCIRNGIRILTPLESETQIVDRIRRMRYRHPMSIIHKLKTEQILLRGKQPSLYIINRILARLS